MPKPRKSTIRETTFVLQVMVRDPNTGKEHQLEIRLDTVTGLFFGVDSTYINSGFSTITNPYDKDFTLSIEG